ncbi:tyrosine-type recombinase/integrase [Serpentinicella alkaliphila]|nr:tyrosine-type recombinase/integrase [Serpentinicella alkaliphila]
MVSPDTLKHISRLVNYELIIPFKFHSIGHTDTTMLLEAGANIKEIQGRLGHSKLSTTMDTYSHITSKLKQDSVDRFESMIK